MRSGRLVFTGLDAPETGVDPALRDQLLVGPDFPHLAEIHHVDAVGVADRGQSMRDDQRRPPDADVRQGALDRRLGLVVDSRGRPVQDQDGVVGAALRTEPHNVVLAAPSAEGAVETLVDALIAECEATAVPCIDLVSLSGRSDVVPSPCLGQCDRSPAVLLQQAGEPDLSLWGATPQNVIAVLAGPALGAECVECHKNTTPGVVTDWSLSKHAENDVGCDTCHGGTGPVDTEAPPADTLGNTAATDRAVGAHQAHDPVDQLGLGHQHLLLDRDLHGEAERVHASGEFLKRFEVSPDDQWLAFRENYHIYVLPLPPGGKPVSLGTKVGSLPMTRATGDGGNFPSWSGANTIFWTLGPDLYSTTTESLFAPADESGDGGFTPPASSAAVCTR